jgi:hypothetical protein
MSIKISSGAQSQHNGLITIANQIVCNDGFPTAILEKGNDIFAGLDITVSIKTHVNKCLSDSNIHNNKSYAN